jgi:iron complex outermembrane recepter protein
MTPHRARCSLRHVTLALLAGCLGSPLAFAQEPDAPPVRASQGEVTPPRLLQSAPPIYPASASQRAATTVELLVTIGKRGEVQAVEVATPGDAQLDAAAKAAVRSWRFESATRAGQPVVSRIRVAVDFVQPQPQPQPAPASAEIGVQPPDGAAGVALPSPLSPTAQPPVEIVVHGEHEVRSEERSAADFRIQRDILAAAPHSEGADLLRAAPGLYVGRGEGPAVAHNYMLRGFDAEHGQDLELRVGGLPINLPSHLHGQGYADLGFLIGDVVRELLVSEGVYDPRQGDFAVAGTIDIGLGVDESERGVRLASGYGSYGTFQQLAVWAPRGEPAETFGAMRYMKTAGFGENRAAQTGTGIFQHRFGGDGDVAYRVLGIAHTARAESAGVLRQDDVDAGRICFECVYPYATSRAQNGLANRMLVGVFADVRNQDGGNGQLGGFIGYDTFRLQRNSTGFLEQSRSLQDVSGRGDLIEQQNRTLTLGLTARHRMARARPASWLHGTLELGADARLDTIEQAQNLLDASVRGQTWDRRVDAGIRSMDLGMWSDLDWVLWRRLHARLGVRADVLSYEVEDRLGNFAPSVRPQDAYIVGFRRSALGLAWGPRSSVELHALSWLSLLAAYGEGYRSPQARQLEDGESAPFSKVRSADAGVRFDFGEPLRLTVGGYYTQLSDDVAFDASKGRLERIGGTRRLGATAQLVIRPTSWLVESFSATVVDAALLEPPPATAEEPQPAFARGQRLPFVPPVVLRADLAAERELTTLSGRNLSSRVGVGFSFLSPRPLPYGEYAAPVALLDASVGLKLRPFDVTLEGFNLFGNRYAAVEYNFASDWDPNDGVRPRTPARHVAAGAPRTFLVSLGVTL